MLSQTLCTEYIISANIIILHFLAINHSKDALEFINNTLSSIVLYLWYNGDLVPKFMEANLLCIHIVYHYGAVDFGHSKHQADQGAFASPCTSHQPHLQHFNE